MSTLTDFLKASHAAENSLQNFFLAQRFAQEGNQAQAREFLLEISKCYKNNLRTMHEFRDRLATVADSALTLQTSPVVPTYDPNAPDSYNKGKVSEKRVSKTFPSWHSAVTHLWLLAIVLSSESDVPHDLLELVGLDISACATGLQHERIKIAGLPKLDDNWPTQTEVQKGFNLNFRNDVKRLIENGDLKTNGEAGRACRIDPASVLKYANRSGITWNDS